MMSSASMNCLNYTGLEKNHGMDSLFKEMRRGGDNHQQHMEKNCRHLAKQTPENS